MLTSKMAFSFARPAPQSSRASKLSDFLCGDSLLRKEVFQKKEVDAALSLGLTVEPDGASLWLYSVGQSSSWSMSPS